MAAIEPRLSISLGHTTVQLPDLAQSAIPPGGDSRSAIDDGRLQDRGAGAGEAQLSLPARDRERDRFGAHRLSDAARQVLGDSFELEIEDTHRSSGPPSETALFLETILGLRQHSGETYR